MPCSARSETILQTRSKMESCRLHFYRAKDLTMSGSGYWERFKMMLKNAILFGGFVYVVIEYDGTFFHSIKPKCRTFRKSIKSECVVDIPVSECPDFTDWVKNREYTVWRTLADFFLHIPQDRYKIVNCTLCCCRALRMDTKKMRIPRDLYKKVSHHGSH